jgi:ribosomal-protein-alanine N-acetyltransferase|nr:GNAT family N-acetyltransferase [Dictyoglomus turgidum]
MESFKNFPVLETSRLVLRKLFLEDAQDIFDYAKDLEVNKYEKEGYGDWGIEYKENKKIIGTCGFVWWDRKNYKAEIGYVLSRKYWNQGLMTEAVR